ncbi:MAG TPA: rRNA maturation RNase YbeY [Gemmatimonadales bacterium]|nr:rRNA maturation RNase YbeY [Gemmatimonadales bacterium]
MSVHGRRLALAAPVVRRVVRAVLRGERRRALVSVTFIGRDRMRSLNARYKGADRPTDVLAFALAQPGTPRLADVYVCAWAAARAARAHGIPLRQELIRLVVHGTLHALGHDHPDGSEARIRSAMWRRQERYVEALA